MATLDINAGLERIQNADEEASGSLENGAWVKFGNFGTGSVHMQDYTVEIYYKLENEVVNADNSIDVDFYGVARVHIFSEQFNTETNPAHTNYSMEVDTNNDGSLENVWTFNSDMNTPVNFDQSFTSSTPDHYHIPPQSWVQITKRRMLHFLNDARDADDEFYYTIGDGQGIFNPLPNKMREGAVYDGSTFKTLNVNEGFRRVFDGTNWIDLPMDDYSDIGVANKGHARIFDGNNFVQQSTIGD